MQLSRVFVSLLAAGGIVASGWTAFAADIPGAPGLNVTVTHVSEHTPVYIIRDERHVDSASGSDPHFVECIDFRVLSRKAVSAVRFTMHFRDDFNNEFFPGFNGTSAWTLDRKGFFNSGDVVRANFDGSRRYLNDGSESCWQVPSSFTAPLGGITKLSIETTEVAFADGSTWRSGQSFDQAFMPNGDRFTGQVSASPSPTPRPNIAFRQRWVTAGHAPIELLGSGTSYDFGNNPQQCVTFRNVANQAATAVDFAVWYVDGNDNRVLGRTVEHVGTFTPPVLIEDKCREINLGNGDQMRRMRTAEVHVSRVVFNDGTEWREGQAFTRVFGNNGDRLPSPLFVAAANAPVVLPTNNGLPPVQPFGPNTNGTVVNPGAHFGAIAIDQTATFGAVAVDRESPGAAAADAISTCNARSGGNTCVVKVSMSTDRCGAIAKRVLQGVPVVFLSTGGTQRAAEADALNKAGATDASILASGCNTQ